MEFWIARNKFGSLHMYSEEPILLLEAYFLGSNDCILEKTLFPEVTFENSPRKVKIELIEE